jgi:hypothetical protein
MRRSRHLAELYERTGKRLLVLRQLVDSCRPPIGSYEDRTLAYVTIEAVNLIRAFHRAYYLSCARSAKAASGAMVLPARGPYANSESALDRAVRFLKPDLNTRSPGTVWRMQEEPAWNETNPLLKLSSELALSNDAQIQSAFSYSTRAYRDLPVMRNFFAHRSDVTAIKAKNIARSYGLPGTMHPSTIVRSTRRGRPQSIMSDWLDDVRHTSFLLCQ